MTETDLDIPTTDGTMNTRVVSPGDSGPHPVVLFYMDAFGVREELHEMARRFAAKGYLVLLPNLYYRETRRFAMKAGEAGMNEMRVMMGRLSIERVNRDTQAMLSFLDTRPDADPRRVGAVGYCMSGPFVFAAATEFPDRIAAIASIHGANMVTDRADSPHRAAARLRCEAYVACAEVDKWASTADMAVLERELQASGAPFQLEWYPGAQHGFVFPSRSGAYEHASAERHWLRLFDLFGRRL